MVGVALILAGCTPEQTQAYDEINASRRTAGVVEVAWDETVGNGAQAHAEAMASRGSIFHATLPAGSCSSENVAMASSIKAAHELFMSSDLHRSHVLDSAARTAGTGVALRDGKYYVVQRFTRSC